MAHYDCSCCGESFGISHAHCPECQAGRCSRATPPPTPLVSDDCSCEGCVPSAGGEIEDDGFITVTPSLPENPKAIHGRAKPSIGLVPAGALIQMAGVMQLGADKYGPFNWRKDPVEAMTYVHASIRHILSWVDGEHTDPESGESHLAHAASCMAILLDAMACGALIDDRPNPGTAADLIRTKTKTF